MFCDEAHDICYGVAGIPLGELAFGGPVKGVFDILNSQNSPCGTIEVELKWSDVYSIDATPIISKLDDPSIHAEMLQEQPALQKPETQNTVVVGVSLDSVVINLEDPEVQERLKNTQQMFFSYGFLGYPIDELESQSLALMSGSIPIHFKKGKEQTSSSVYNVKQN